MFSSINPEWLRKLGLSSYMSYHDAIHDDGPPSYLPDTNA